MVFLRDIPTQWPWNPNVKDLSDKEIYTHRVDEEDASSIWRVPVLEPLHGFAYTGMRVSVYGKPAEYTMVPRLVIGETQRGMFGLPWDNTLVNNGCWAPLGFPLTHKMIAISEDGLDYIIKHPEPCWGQVEFVGQKFDDLLEDESDISYLFLNHRTDKIEWVLNEENLMFRFHPMDGPVYHRKSKLMPSMLRLLDKQRNTWQDTEVFWNAVNIPAPFLQ